ncbi:MAG: hypothetical protein HN778_16890 [Prolixibacteraceae bacterium]|jgi:hypothetical protein|nr:hypothetical protein [Prolixibacteraceae bacterium]MBT6004943.1 hypothetical protein [Prolixibacteraceae bacterium]MBT6764799.1 hypothetical protein [Prolixibacteraceae bacterium]MBT6997722.1 hypothetical protein [Prolixibacteraceae bacterium]MBT7396506.1 hypothetical protein [Prolixibacteraceae bacterium]
MQKKPSIKYPFPHGWYTIGYGEQWDILVTYGFLPFELLPPIDPQILKGEFQWLPELSGEWEKFVMMEDLSNNFSNICKSAENLGIELPKSFLNFMGSPLYQNHMISSTNCYFELPEKITKSPGNDGGYFIRFMNDEQDAMLWYLYIDKEGNHSVATSRYVIDYNYFSGPSLEKILEDIVICAPSFEEFIYRFWIENRIWHSSIFKLPISKVEEDYLNKAIELINNSKSG